MPVADKRGGDTDQPNRGDAHPPWESRDQMGPAVTLGGTPGSPGALYTSVRVPAPKNPEHDRPLADAILEVTSGSQTLGRPYISLAPPTGGTAWHVKGGDARQVAWDPDTETLTFLLT